MSIRSWTALSIVEVALMALAPIAWAQDPESAAAPAVKPDMAFDRYVDVNQLADAWSSMDIGALCDLALQLSEGERVLARPHEGIGPADQLLIATIRAAASKKDLKVLERLESVCKAQNKKALLDLIAGAKKLAAGSRAAGPISDADLAKLPPETAQAVKDIVAAIENAAAAGDKATLDAIGQGLSELKGLSDSQMAALKKMVATAAEGAPSKDATTEMLGKLSSGSRAAPTPTKFFFVNTLAKPVLLTPLFNASPRPVGPKATMEIVATLAPGQPARITAQAAGGPRGPASLPLTAGKTYKLVQQGPLVGLQ